MTQTTVSVALAADAGYAMPMTVAARSVVESLDAGVRLQLCILDMGIDGATRVRVEQSLFGPNVELVWIDSLVDRVNDFPNTWPVITRATYARIYLPEVLPAVDRVLYLDCDVMARRSVSELFAADMNGYFALATPDVQAPFVPFGVPDWFEAGRSAAELNYNAGVMLLDLDAWRTHGITEELLHYLTGGRHLRGQDQEAINVVLGKRIGEMDPRWNQQGEIFWEGIQYHYEEFLPFTHAMLEQIRRDPWIVHFSNRPKPWDYGCDHPFAGEWYALLDRTAFAGRRPKGPNRAQRIAAKLGRPVVRGARKVLTRA
ncbi:MAG TPA: glycosyltransferase family 8 protein [Acidimicrobiia bacterium]|nr:glycosyltransferase family 8 protein [Acidimicrobiia bacterium]